MIIVVCSASIILAALILQCEARVDLSDRTHIMVVVAEITCVVIDHANRARDVVPMAVPRINIRNWILDESGKLEPDSRSTAWGG